MPSDGTRSSAGNALLASFDVADKPRTPPPPRRVQAPKARAGGDGDGGRRTTLLVLVAGAVAVLAAAVAVGVFAFGGETASNDEVIAEAGCELETFPAQSRDHVEEPPEDFEHNSFPPTSGPHHPVSAPWGIYDQPVDQLHVVHNLEHGGVVIQYGEGVPQSEIDAIAEWYRGDPNGLVVAPLPALESQIALGAWTQDVDARGRDQGDGQGVLAKCERFDAAAFDAFLDEYGFRGPERFPRDQLRPGT
jgi:hypothetical protein